ncbi:MAG TPA: DUF5686 family protein [Bacteroidia bacterium]
MALLCMGEPIYGQFYKITGVVSNSAMEPIAYVNVSVQDHSSLRTSTDIKGRYEIKITEGTYVLIFTMANFKTLKIPVTVNGADVVQNCIMEESVREMKAVKVSAKKEDISEKIIKYAIEAKYKYQFSNPYSVDAYIKATESVSTQVKKKDTAAIKEQQGGLSIAEVFLTVHFSPPDKIKEERKGVDIRGDKSGLFYLTHTDGNFNFYKNLLEVPALSESPFLSPISNSGLIAYKYKMLEIFRENNIKYYRIKVQPGMMGNALVTGELVIQDSTWNIKSLSLSLPKYHLTEYDFFEVNQAYELNDSQYLLTKQEFNYKAKFGKQASSGRTAVYYSNYRLNAEFKKRFFSNELSSTTQEAYERDSSFWKNIRQEPYTPTEIAYIRKSDSLKAVFSQKHWQDSADSVYNRITFKKVMFTGQGFYKRSKEREWQFKPLAFIYTPFYVAGPRVNYWVYYSREYKNKKFLSIFPNVNFGLLNQDLKGSLTVYRLYNPFKSASYTLSGGSDFGVINPYNSWLKLFTRSNFYAHDYLSGYHRVELLNGLYLGTGAEYSNRRAISNMKFDPKGDRLWGDSNTTVDFNYYKAFYANLSITYVPFQKYIREPYRKLVLGSKWPELSVRYRKGMNVLGSTVDFDYWEFVAEQEVKIGLAGISKYRVVSGEFLNMRDLRLVDYKFQRSAGPYFFTNPLYAFQGIDTSYATFKRFYEGHYFHRFNGALINKIPLLKKLNIIEVAGVGMLYTHERNLRYVEAFVGFEKIIRLWKERIKLGFFVVMGDSNRFNYPTQFKFTIETYNNVTNKWPY